MLHISQMSFLVGLALLVLGTPGCSQGASESDVQAQTPIFSRIHTASIHIKNLQTFNKVFDLLSEDIGLTPPRIEIPRPHNRLLGYFLGGAWGIPQSRVIGYRPLYGILVILRSHLPLAWLQTHWPGLGQGCGIAVCTCYR